jgi:Xaa-Pro dipeptidase
MKIEPILSLLRDNHADAWVLTDYENRNPMTIQFLGNKMLTRKIFIVIPVNGKPYLITHAIDTVFLSDKVTLEAFDLKVYHTWQEMLALEKENFKNYRKVLMDVSEKGLLPRVSLADFGSVDYIRSLGIEVASSADIIQFFTAAYSDRSYQLQRKADELTLKIKDEAFAQIRKDIETKGLSDEYDIQQFICRRFHEEGMVYDDPAIVAIGRTANNPHYGPTKEIHSTIHRGDLVLIDMWAKMDDPEGVYADITWMGYVGEIVPKIFADRFSIVKNARDSAIAFLKKELPHRPVEGYEVDDVARKVITEAGYGDYFIHRTGHNIAVDVSPHGPGANMDDYESHDTRQLIDHTSFSIEPGIYAPDFGVRSETNVFVDGKEPVVVAGLQDEIIPILKK